MKSFLKKELLINNDSGSLEILNPYDLHKNNSINKTTFFQENLTSNQSLPQQQIINKFSPIQRPKLLHSPQNKFSGFLKSKEDFSSSKAVNAESSNTQLMDPLCQNIFEKTTFENHGALFHIEKKSLISEELRKQERQTTSVDEDIDDSIENITKDDQSLRIFFQKCLERKIKDSKILEDSDQNPKLSSPVQILKLLSQKKISISRKRTFKEKINAFKNLQTFLDISNMIKKMNKLNNDSLSSPYIKEIYSSKDAYLEDIDDVNLRAEDLINKAKSYVRYKKSLKENFNSQIIQNEAVNIKEEKKFCKQKSFEEWQQADAENKLNVNKLLKNDIIDESDPLSLYKEYKQKSDNVIKNLIIQLNQFIRENYMNQNQKKHFYIPQFKSHIIGSPQNVLKFPPVNMNMNVNVNENSNNGRKLKTSKTLDHLRLEKLKEKHTLNSSESQYEIEDKHILNFNSSTESPKEIRSGATTNPSKNLKIKLKSIFSKEKPNQDFDSPKQNEVTILSDTSRGFLMNFTKDFRIRVLRNQNIVKIKNSFLKSGKLSNIKEIDKTRKNLLNEVKDNNKIDKISEDYNLNSNSEI